VRVLEEGKPRVLARSSRYHRRVPQYIISIPWNRMHNLCFLFIEHFGGQKGATKLKV